MMFVRVLACILKRKSGEKYELEAKVSGTGAGKKEQIL